jgi:hypothetical protein
MTEKRGAASLARQIAITDGAGEHAKRGEHAGKDPVTASSENPNSRS